MKRVIMLVLFLIIFSSLTSGAHAQEVSFINGYTNKIVSNVIVSSFLSPSYSDPSYPNQTSPVLYWISTMPSNNTFSPAFSRAILPDDEFTFFLDDLRTPGNDYAAKASASSWLSSSLYPPKIPVFPSATVQGLVKDKLDNVVGNADIKFSCQNNNGLHTVLHSDAFGSFRHDALPAGACRIFASYKNAVGITDVALSQGDLKNAEIILDKTIVVEKESASFFGLSSFGLSSDFFIVFSGVLVIFFILIIFWIVFHNKKNKSLTIPIDIPIKFQSSKNPANDNAMIKRREDIIATLASKEKDIVSYLSGLPGYRANQSKIRYETAIPRTSLTRTLQSLEIKKIVSLIKIGKLVKVKLTPWFLDQKEETEDKKAEDEEMGNE